MRRRRFWWRNPDPEEDLLDLELPPDDDVDFDAELAALGEDVPPSLEVPIEDYEIETEEEALHRGHSVGPAWGHGGMSVEEAQKLISRKRSRGRPSVELAQRLAEARHVLGLKSGQRLRGKPAVKAANLWGSECLCETDASGVMNFSKKCPLHQSLAVAVSDFKKSKKAKPTKKSEAKASKSKKLTKTQALKVVAQFAGKRGKRSGDFKAALKVLCRGSKRRRNRGR